MINLSNTLSVSQDGLMEKVVRAIEAKEEVHLCQCGGYHEKNVLK